MSVGQVVIDLQHKQLFNQINVLLSTIINKLEPKTVDDTVAFLGQYINGHLRYEEEYMLKNNYPDFDTHKSFHEDFINNYKKVREDRAGGVPIETIAWDIEKYLGNWFIHHIGEADKKYAEYIKNLSK